MKKRHKASGGPASGSKEYDEDMKATPRRDNAPAIEGAAEEKKKGGRVARKSGGSVHGSMGMSHGGRKPRASGGRSGSNMNPMSSAHAGSSPPGHSTTRID